MIRVPLVVGKKLRRGCDEFTRDLDPHPRPRLVYYLYITFLGVFNDIDVSI